MSSISGYDIIRKIGEGSFSEVLKVRDKTTGKCFAAKKLRKLYDSLTEVMNCAEIKAVRDLETHPNIVGVVDIVYDVTTKELSLITELLDMNMYDYIKNRKRCLSEVRVKKYLFQLACGLNHLHRNGIFHRDIKPENILIKVNRRLKDNPLMNEIVQLADLGSVCNIHTKPPHSSYISTRWYRAPETLLTSGHYGSKIDIWAVGCVFYEMLTLNPLFPGESEMDQLFKIHEIIGTPSERTLNKFRHRSLDYNFPQKKAIRFQDLVPWLSPNGTDVLKKTLVYHPDLRISVYKLLDHGYFNDLRQRNKKLSYAHSSTPALTNSSTLNSATSFRPSTRCTKDCTLSFNTESCINTAKFWTTPASAKQSPVVQSISNESKLKMKERLWGMNQSVSKNRLIESISSRRIRRNT